MNELFKTVGNLIRFIALVVRFPFFCAGVLLWAIIILPVTIVITAWQIVCIPFMFLDAAFQNKPELLKDHINATFNFDVSAGCLRDLKAWFFQNC